MLRVEGSDSVGVGVWRGKVGQPDAVGTKAHAHFDQPYLSVGHGSQRPHTSDEVGPTPHRYCPKSRLIDFGKVVVCTAS